MPKETNNYEGECLFGLSFPGPSPEVAQARFDEAVLAAADAGWCLPEGVEVRALRHDDLGCCYGVFEPFYWVPLHFRSAPITGVVPRKKLDEAL